MAFECGSQAGPLRISVPRGRSVVRRSRCPAEGGEFSRHRELCALCLIGSLLKSIHPGKLGRLSLRDPSRDQRLLSGRSEAGGDSACPVTASPTLVVAT